MLVRLLQDDLVDAEYRMAEDGGAGLTLAREWGPDLVLLDAMMPGLTGFDVCKQLKEHPGTADIPVLMISGMMVEERHRVTGLESGAEGYVCKPFANGELLAQVHSLLRLKRYLDQLHAEEQLLEQRLEERTRRLRASEEQFGQLFNASPDAIIVTDMQGNVLDANRAACDVTGRTHKVLGAQSLSTLVRLPDADAFFHCLSQPRGADVRCDAELLAAVESDSLPVEIRACAITYHGARAVLIHLRDIKARYDAESALRRDHEGLEALVAQRTREMEDAMRAVQESDERHRLIAENSYELVAEFDRESTYLYANARHREILGYEPEELLAHRLIDLLEEEDGLLIQQLFDAIAAAPGVIHRSSFRIDAKHGDTRWLECAGRAYRTLAGLRIVLTFLDVTERRKILGELNESRRNFHAIVEKSSEGILVVDRDALIVYANPEAARLMGHAVDALECTRFDYTLKVGRPLEIIFDTETEAPVITEAVVAHTEWNAQPAYLVSLRDITARKAMEKNMLRSENLAAVEVLAGGIAHDFNNLLSGIIGNLSFAKNEKTNRSDIEGVLAEAERAALRAKTLTQQLLTFSKGGNPLRKTASVTEVARETAGFSLAGSKNKLEFSTDEDVWPAYVDLGQISQVIENLVINADQAMAGSGRVRVHVANYDCRNDGDTRGNALETGRYVRIEVADEGPGIPEDLLNRIFEPYFTTKNEGSGLGLAICYSIVSKHGGHIAVQSREGEGTTFDVYLPASDAPLSAGVAETLPTVQGDGHVLVMDDEDFIRSLLGKMLTALGYTVAFAADGEEALSLYGEAMRGPRPFDVVLLDLTVPGGMGGEETLRELRRMDPNVCAVVSSGYSDAPVVSAYAKYGFRGGIAKPYDMGELSRVLSKVIGRR